MRALAHVVAGLLALSGCALVVLYVLVALGRIGSFEDVREVGILAGLGVAAIVGAILLELSVLRRRGAELVAHFRMPPIWASAIVFALTVAAGGVAMATDWIPALEPVLAVIGIASVATLVLRLVIRWSPRRRAPGYTVLVTLAWGMFAATSAAVVMQFGFIAAGIGGIAAGLSRAGAPVTSGLMDTLLSEEFLTESGGDLIGTTTVAVFLMLSYAVAAPLTEELTKFLGVVVALRRRVLTRYTVFVAGICAGLGFAVLETIGYALGAGESWLLIMVIRAPVTLIHVTGTSLVACGWYLQRRRGGMALVGYFAAAVLVHAAWNGLLVSIMLAAGSLPADGDPSPLLALAILGAVGMMVALLGGCLAWVISNARRLGREYVDAPSITFSPVSPRQRLASLSVENPRVSGPLSGEV